MILTQIKKLYWKAVFYLRYLYWKKHTPIVTVSPIEGDNSQRLQLAINYLAEKYDGGTVWLKGTYSFQNSIELKDNIRLQGN